MTLPTLSPSEMDMVRQIRRDYAQATKAMMDNRTKETQKAYDEVKKRRDRAIRMLYSENFSVRQICAMLMCSKNYVKEAIDV